MLEDDLLQQARSADLAGQYRKADDLRHQWCEMNRQTCQACGGIFYPGYHDRLECEDKLLRPIMED